MGWLIAYDIADPKRWRRVYAAISPQSYRLQYSLYWLPSDAAGAHALAEIIRPMINPAADDVRFYAFPEDAWCRLWGPKPWGEGVTNLLSQRFASSWRPEMPVDSGGTDL